MDTRGRVIAREPTGWPAAAKRGFLGRCPACGQGRLFGRFLKVADRCQSCGMELHHHRADDLPPYLVIFLVGHLIGWGILVAETRFEAPLWIHLALWPTLTVVLCLLLLQPVKGAVVGLQYALGMHGFGLARTAADRGRDWEASVERSEGTSSRGPPHFGGP